MMSVVQELERKHLKNPHEFVNKIGEAEARVLSAYFYTKTSFFDFSEKVDFLASEGSLKTR